MFYLHRTLKTVTIPVSLLVVEETLIEFAYTDLTFHATSADDILELYGLTGTMRFVSDSTEYTAPLDGGDFTTEKTGTLYLKITENLSSGLYRAYLKNSRVLPGACGYSVLGMMQGGNKVNVTVNMPLVIQVQSLPADWRSAATAAAQQYVVDTITRPER